MEKTQQKKSITKFRLGISVENTPNKSPTKNLWWPTTPNQHERPNLRLRRTHTTQPQTPPWPPYLWPIPHDWQIEKERERDEEID